ncbi:MAG: ISAzo13-like element transposase-related protein [Methanosarcinaceae archaeon]
MVFGTSNEIRDFIADGLELWWEKNKKRHSHIKELVINLDNGPHIISHITQFIKRII